MAVFILIQAPVKREELVQCSTTGQIPHCSSWIQGLTICQIVLSSIIEYTRCAWRPTRLSLAGNAQPPTRAQAPLPPDSLSRDWVDKASAHYCHARLWAPTPEFGTLIEVKILCINYNITFWPLLLNIYIILCCFILLTFYTYTLHIIAASWETRRLPGADEENMGDSCWSSTC